MGSIFSLKVYNCDECNGTGNAKMGGEDYSSQLERLWEAVQDLCGKIDAVYARIGEGGSDGR